MVVAGAPTHGLKLANAFGVIAPQFERKQVLRLLFDVWSWHGRIGRGRYLGTGLVLLALKHNINRLLASAFGYRWSISRDATFYAVLVAFALPFVWIGTVLTLRRLRDADWPLWLVILFFLPFFNLIFFIILATVPSNQSLHRP